MQSAATKRLLRDLQKITENPPRGIEACPEEDDIMKWEALIYGPEKTPWEDGIFKLELLFRSDYPNKPPSVRFMSTIFHPNVYKDGKLCQDILDTQWCAIYDVSSILISIQSLLNDPNPNSPANAEAAKLYVEDRQEYYRRVNACIKENLDEISDDDEEEEDEVVAE